MKGEWHSDFEEHLIGLNSIKYALPLNVNRVNILGYTQKQFTQKWTINNTYKYTSKYNPVRNHMRWSQ